METYITKSGQNIFDIALTVHGSVEGMFDLLYSNDWLTLNTPLKAGMKINYHKNFSINSNLSEWIAKNGVGVKNGHRKDEHASIQSIYLLWLNSYHPDEYDELMLMTENSRNAHLRKFGKPRIIISQSGVECNITTWLYPNTYMVIDWGDNSAPQFVENTDMAVELSHGYQGSGKHEIRLYGNFNLYMLDLSEINGTYYVTEPVYADEVVDSMNIPEHQTLITTT